MEKRNVKKLVIILALIIGSFATHINTGNFVYVWVISSAFLFFLMLKIRYRCNYVFASLKDLRHSLTETEKDIFHVILIFMASPIIFLMTKALYETVAL